MYQLRIVPGALAPAAAQTIPAGAPQIRSIISATITHIPAALADHPPADVVGALLNHAVHSHHLDVGAAAVATPYGASAGGNDIVDGAGQAIPGGGATGVQNNAAVQAHAAAAGVLAHVAGNPVVAATATRITDTTFSINVAILVGDVLTLVYNEVGEVVRVS